ncbi:type II secretion system protein [Sulfurimonas diazotrophicus]|uniref:Prepilin-type N-terminal cleavage/methylation domain-containing protein n=1 Tax=Sulfurimonas diazotrophicus TaxID=3131939 RepID=A0ABZ3H8S2_9BACT
MKRTAFTLMELLISVVLIAMLALFLYGALGGSRASNQTMQRHADAEAKRLKQFTLLYRDCVESYAFGVLSTNDKHYQVLQLQTKNSLYGIAAPYVTYFVHAETLQLVRLEAAFPITLPVPYDDKERIHINVIDSDVTDFNIYTGKVKETQDQNSTTAAGDSAAAAAGTEGSTAALEGGARTIKSHLLYLKTKGTQQPLLMELAF